jgi:hypothetical protein
MDNRAKVIPSARIETTMTFTARLLHTAADPFPGLNEQTATAEALPALAAEQGVEALVEGYRFPDRLFWVADSRALEPEAALTGALFGDRGGLHVNVWWGSLAIAEAVLPELWRAWRDSRPASIEEPGNESGGLIGLWQEGDRAWLATVFSGANCGGRFETANVPHGLLQVGFDFTTTTAADLWGSYQDWMAHQGMTNARDSGWFLDDLRQLVVPELHEHIDAMRAEAGLG